MEKETSRIEAFSDGIFAVAITLLSLDIGVSIKDLGTVITNENLTHKLLLLWPKYFGYFNSFATVLIMWMTHHRIFKMLRYTNVHLQLLNGLLLQLIALVPFPTKTVGEFINTPAIAAAVVFYSAYFILVGIAFISLTIFIRNNEKIRMPHITKQIMDKMIKGQLFGMSCNVVITTCAFFYPKVALLITFLMWIFWAAMTRDEEDKIILT
jgi:uncharacterized membrane protein